MATPRRWINVAPIAVCLCLDLTPLVGAEPMPRAAKPSEQSVAHQIDIALFQAHDPSTPLPALADDAAFLRRVSLDLTGKLPGPDEIRAFSNDGDPDKRA